MKYLKQILTLILIIHFLTELLKYNIPVNAFFNPITFLVLIIIYGVAVLILRELSVRWNLGVVGIIILGLAYGIYNEGIIAKTLLMTTTVPLAESYGHYSLFLGINFAFALAILTWHAFHSVLFPILIINYLFPKSRNEIWLNNFWLSIISVIIIGFGVLFFFTVSITIHWIYLIIFYLIIISLVLLSKFTKSKLELKHEKVGLKPVVFGVLFIVIYFVGLHALGSMKSQIHILYIYFTIVILSFYKILKLKNWLSLKPLLLFGFGSYLLHVLLLIFKGLKTGAFDMLITGIILFTIFLVSIFYVNKSK